MSAVKVPKTRQEIDRAVVYVNNREVDLILSWIAAARDEGRAEGRAKAVPGEGIAPGATVWCVDSGDYPNLFTIGRQYIVHEASHDGTIRLTTNRGGKWWMWAKNFSPVAPAPPPSPLSALERAVVDATCTANAARRKWEAMPAVTSPASERREAYASFDQARNDMWDAADALLATRRAPTACPVDAEAFMRVSG